MSDHDPPGSGRGSPSGVIAGETTPPAEYTQRVRARTQQGNLRPGSDSEAEPSSTELSERNRRQRRRERDGRAERRAMFWVVGLFLGFGGAALVAVNVLIEDPPPAVVEEADAKASEDASGEAPVAKAPPARAPGVFSTPLEETPDLPALRALNREGLTIGAEGLPEVVWEAGSGSARQAALQTCRFAFGVWEFSPNKRFRFLTTCPALEGQVLVGAYRVDGTVIRMSPLDVPGGRIVSELFVERPTKMVSRVAASSNTVLRVNQRITSIRPGMEGDAFQNAFAPRNPLNVGGTVSPAQAPPVRAPAAPPAKRDPLLDLLKTNGSKQKPR